MIILNLKGGLGNQMFQYACGRALSLRNTIRNGEAMDLKLDITGLQKSLSSDTPRSYGLQAFNITENIAIAGEIAETKYPFGPLSKALRLFNAKILGRHYVAFSQKIFDIHTDTDTKPHNIYLDGFFQSEKYFKDVADQIRKDFTLKNPLSPYSADIMKKIIGTETSISLHIRRGDYVTTASDAFISLPLSYYENALSYISKAIAKNNTPTDLTSTSNLIDLYIFSDDIPWVKENIASLEKFATVTSVTFVSTPDTPLHEEIAMMSACDHHIIANSSFSWWGAWLDPRPNKIVIAPKVWSKHNESWYKDIIPESWVRL